MAHLRFFLGKGLTNLAILLGLCTQPLWAGLEDEPQGLTTTPARQTHPAPDIFQAIDQKNREVFDRLLADPRTNLNALTGDYGDTPLHGAIRGREEHFVRKLLEDPRTQVNQATLKGLTPLQRAIGNGSLSILDLLLTCDRTEVNALGVQKVTALTYGIYQKNLEAVRRLLEHPLIDITRALEEAISHSQRNFSTMRPLIDLLLDRPDKEQWRLREIASDPCPPRVHRVDRPAASPGP